MIPVNAPLLEGNELAYVTECIRSGWVSSEGPFVERFENEMAAKVQRRYGVAVSNGSVALDLCMAALRIGPGDEVIVPTFSIISCAAAIIRAGATAVLVDSDSSTWNMVPDEVESKITSRTRAIMVVHTYGLPVEMDRIETIAKKRNLAIIEDAAEMHGQTFRGRPIGSFGDLSSFSFYPNKHITTGEGGMVLTNDAGLADRLRSLRNLCFRAEKRFVHDELGWNFRLSNVQAAIGVAQLERLDEFVARKRRMGARYQELLEGISGVGLPAARMDGAESIYWVFGLLLNDSFPRDAEWVSRSLAKLGVGTRPFFWPMHEQPVFRSMGLFVGDRFPVAERLARRGFYIPSGLALTENQIVEVSACVRKVASEA